MSEEMLGKRDRLGSDAVTEVEELPEDEAYSVPIK
jgi:hypothetical protein